MEKASIREEIRVLQNRVRKLEQELAEAKSALEATSHPTSMAVPGSWGHLVFEAPYPIMLRRSDGRVLMINKIWTEITGYAIEDIPTLDDWARRAYGEHAAQRQEFIRQQGFSQSAIKKWGEFEVFTHSGETRIWDFSTAPLGLDELEREIVMVMAVDVTERKQAETALQESEQKFSVLFDKAPFAAALSKIPGGQFININEEFERMFGFSRKDAIGRTALELGLDPDETQRANLLAQIRAHGSARNVEARLSTKAGERRVFLLNVDIVRLGDEEYALQTAQDITESKIAEQSLRESEQRFHSLADSMPQLVWTALPDGSVDYYNQRYREYREIRQVKGTAWEWSPVLHPDDKDATVRAWQHAISSGEIYQMEHRVRMADGSYRWHLSRGIPAFDENGQVVRWFGTATDIHEWKLAEEKLKDYAARLERSNRELEEFAFIASHDMQEPLRKIQVFGDLLRDHALNLADPERDYLERMYSAAGRMREMVNGLLQLSRVNTQSQPFTDVDLSQVTVEALSDLAVQIRDSGGKVVMNPLPVVTGDALQLRQLMQNLIGNALKYQQPGVPPRVKVHAEAAKNAVQIFIEDNGIGFEQVDAERIFQPFVRLVGRSQYEGSGMGLAICRKIVEGHGGEITASSVAGQGTIFVITLPIPAQPNSGKEHHEL